MGNTSGRASSGTHPLGQRACSPEPLKVAATPPDRSCPPRTPHMVDMHATCRWGPARGVTPAHFDPEPACQPAGALNTSSCACQRGARPRPVWRGGSMLSAGGRQPPSISRRLCTPSMPSRQPGSPCGPSQRRLHRSSPDLRLPARPAQLPAASTPARTEPPAGGAPLGGRRSLVPALIELRLCCLPIVHRCHWGIRAGGICAGGGSMHLGSLNMRHAFQEPPPPDCTTLVLLSTIH